MASPSESPAVGVSASVSPPDAAAATSAALMPAPVSELEFAGVAVVLAAVIKVVIIVDGEYQVQGRSHQGSWHRHQHHQQHL